MWLYQVLHVLNASHDIFAPSYRYVRENNQISQTNLALFENNDGFFDDAVELKPNKNGKQRLMRVPKAVKLQMQMEVQQAKLAQMQEKIEKTKQMMEEDCKKAKFNPFQPLPQGTQPQFRFFGNQPAAQNEAEQPPQEEPQLSAPVYHGDATGLEPNQQLIMTGGAD